MADIRRKIKSNRGESLAELLLSVLVISLGLSMFATALLSSKKILQHGGTKIASYYAERSDLEAEKAEKRETGSIRIGEKQDASSVLTFGARIGARTDGTEDGSYQINLYHAGDDHTGIWRYGR